MQAGSRRKARCHPPPLTLLTTQCRSLIECKSGGSIWCITRTTQRIVYPCIAPALATQRARLQAISGSARQGEREEPGNKFQCWTTSFDLSSLWDFDSRRRLSRFPVGGKASCQRTAYMQHRYQSKSIISYKFNSAPCFKAQCLPLPPHILLPQLSTVLLVSAAEFIMHAVLSASQSKAEASYENSCVKVSDVEPTPIHFQQIWTHVQLTSSTAAAGYRP